MPLYFKNVVIIFRHFPSTPNSAKNPGDRRKKVPFIDGKMAKTMLLFNEKYLFYQYSDKFLR